MAVRLYVPAGTLFQVKKYGAAWLVAMLFDPWKKATSAMEPWRAVASTWMKIP
jgi:hypothetical protein